MKKASKKKFNQKIDCSYLDSFNDIINSSDCFCRKIINKNIDKKAYRYQYYNQLCTCMIRIRETSIYLENFEFKQDNDFRQAFDFYEFMNCLWIVYGCTDDLFSVFGLELSKYISGTHCFEKSNLTKSDDIKFFKFIRSAASAHPSETTRFNKITNHKLEVYPYALWRANSISYIFTNEGGDSDIELLSWASTTKCKYKRYYLYIDEFYLFINNVVSAISNLIPVAQKVIDDNVEKLRCKRLKKPKSFNDYNEYVSYLRYRLRKLKLNGEFPDGGLLLARHILQNSIIDDKFKAYIRKRIEKLSIQMQHDITQISFDDIFDELDLYKVISNTASNAHYISEKFYDYLRKETVHEIESGLFWPYKEDLFTYEKADAKFSVSLLKQVYDTLYLPNQIHEMMTFADIYEITLERIYFLTK